MDNEDAFTSSDGAAFTCAGCDRNFAQFNAYSNHLRSCRLQKKRLASALAGAKEAYRRKKLRVNSTSEYAPNQLQGQLPLPLPPFSNEQLSEPVEVESTPNGESDDSVSLAKRRPRRQNRRLPLRYRDERPVAPASLPPSTGHLEAAAILLQSSPPQPLCANPVRQILTSRANTFGLFRQYHAASFPAHDPDSELESADLSDIVSALDQANFIPTSLYQPYPNQNAFLLGEWYWNGGVQKTKEDFKKLIDIVCSEAFNPADVRDVAWDSLNKRLGECTDSSEEDMWLDEPDAGWAETPITLPIPFPKSSARPGLHNYTFPPFRHRSIVSILKEKMANPHDFQQFHLEPYELCWRRGDVSETQFTRVYGELYTSPAFLEAHKEIQASVGEPGCPLPRVVVGLMFGSDATQLTSFGDASLWPCYMYFGNESKYRRCKPTCNLCNHIAYFQKLPPEFKDFAAAHAGGKGPSKPFMTHCAREFLHAQWEVLLDDDFLDAYEHGVVIECCDGIKRRFYLRIFTYSADYQEKTKLSCIRNMGTHPCPRCLVLITDLHLVGTPSDKKQRSSRARMDTLHQRVLLSNARDLIYKSKVPVDSDSVEFFIKPTSLITTESAFSKKLSSFGFNHYSMFVADFMHEIELGVWKNLFIHLLRILQCSEVNGINTMDQRFREVPTFGRDAIRRFSRNVSELKQLGARDYENLLQCALPVFEGLLPRAHNNRLMKLLFTCAHWHALAKLRQHTDLSLDILESTTIHLGRFLKEFQGKTCPAYATRELKREAAARERQAANAKKGSTENPSSDSTGEMDAPNQTPTAGAAPSSSSILTPKETTARPPKVKAVGARRPKTFSLNTYKNHSLGDYVEVIRRYGTVDSYSTEQMELEHRSPKSRYRRTSRKAFEKQLTQIERRQTRIRRIRQKIDTNIKVRSTLSHEKGPESSACDYHIGKTQNHPVCLEAFIRENRRDPAAKDFLKNLRVHLLPRICSRLQIPARVDDAAEVAQTSVLIKDNRIYAHKLARFYYTTYDVRRSEDVINPRTSHCNVMLLTNPNLTSPNDAGLSNPNTASEHPFLYARVIGVYHVNVVYTGPGTTGYEAMRFDFLHVRWFQLDSPHNFRKTSWLDRISFPPMAEEDAFGFVDPSLVLRACHVIPTFSLGKRYSDSIGLSKMSRDAQDWTSYYVNRFADRDMAMRYHWGLGIGHSYSHMNDPASFYEFEEAEAEDLVEHPQVDGVEQGSNVEHACSDVEIDSGNSDVGDGDGRENEEDDLEGDEEDVELYDTYNTY